MSFWNRVSDATRAPAAVGNAVTSGSFKAPKWFGPYAFVGAIGFLGWAVWSGAAAEAVDQFERQLLGLVPRLAVTLVILAILGFLVGWALMKAPKGHFLAEHGKRLIWVCPAALVAGAAIVPIAVAVIGITSDQSTRLAAAYLGARPAANLCQAAGLPAP
ncbi:MAG TPA: hypothetical protein VGU27_00610, partial [Candidatus Eisenbacteria bacterium]|nr:hypothetical protein [Candidatus Eisenbacteria bacterium]